MSEEIMNKAVELSDDEMDKIAGGKTIVIDKYSKNDYMNLVACQSDRVDQSTFVAYLGLQNIGCSYYANRGGSASQGLPSCVNCSYYQTGQTSVAGIKSFKDDGWKVYDMNGKKY